MMRFVIFASLSSLVGSSLFAQSTPHFEIADVQPSGLATNPFTLVSGAVLRGDRYDLRKATLLDLIRISYKVAAESIIGGPNWLEFDRFDIAAKASADPSPEAVRGMLQALLAERFHLMVRNDSRPMPAYALRGGGQAKLTGSKADTDSSCKWIPQPRGSTVVMYSCRNTTHDRLRCRTEKHS